MVDFFFKVLNIYFCVNLIRREVPSTNGGVFRAPTVATLQPSDLIQSLTFDDMIDGRAEVRSRGQGRVLINYSSMFRLEFKQRGFLPAGFDWSAPQTISQYAPG